MQIRCPNCDEKLDRRKNFCPYCGYKLLDTKNSSPIKDEMENFNTKTELLTEVQQKPKRGNNKLIIIMLILFFIQVIAIGGLLLYKAKIKRENNILSVESSEENTKNSESNTKETYVAAEKKPIYTLDEGTIGYDSELGIEYIKDRVIIFTDGDLLPVEQDIIMQQYAYEIVDENALIHTLEIKVPPMTILEMEKWCAGLEELESVLKAVYVAPAY